MPLQFVAAYTKQKCEEKGHFLTRDSSKVQTLFTYLTSVLYQRIVMIESHKWQKTKYQ